MKQIILIMLVYAHIIFSQTYEPSQHKFTWGTGGPEIYISSDSSYFTQTNFLLGWHWGAERKISQALDANQIHGGRNEDTSHTNISDNFINNNLTNIIFGANISASKNIFAQNKKNS